MRRTVELRGKTGMKRLDDDIFMISERRADESSAGKRLMPLIDWLGLR